MLGMTMLSTKPGILKLALAAISASMIFFILPISDIGLPALFYTRDLAGLVTCYFNALPFYPASLAGDLIYSVAMFGIYYLVVRGDSKLQPLIDKIQFPFVQLKTNHR